MNGTRYPMTPVPPPQYFHRPYYQIPSSSGPILSFYRPQPPLPIISHPGLRPLPYVVYPSYVATPNNQPMPPVPVSPVTAIPPQIQATSVGYDNVSPNDQYTTMVPLSHSFTPNAKYSGTEIMTSNNGFNAPLPPGYVMKKFVEGQHTVYDGWTTSSTASSESGTYSRTSLIPTDNKSPVWSANKSKIIPIVDPETKRTINLYDVDSLQVCSNLPLEEMKPPEFVGSSNTMNISKRSKAIPIIVPGTNEEVILNRSNSYKDVASEEEKTKVEEDRITPITVPMVQVKDCESVSKNNKMKDVSFSLSKRNRAIPIIEPTTKKVLNIEDIFSSVKIDNDLSDKSNKIAYVAPSSMILHATGEVEQPQLKVEIHSSKESMYEECFEDTSCHSHIQNKRHTYIGSLNDLSLVTDSIVPDMGITGSSVESVYDDCLSIPSSPTDSDRPMGYATVFKNQGIDTRAEKFIPSSNSKSEYQMETAVPSQSFHGDLNKRNQNKFHVPPKSSSVPILDDKFYENKDSDFFNKTENISSNGGRILINNLVIEADVKGIDRYFEQILRESMIKQQNNEWRKHFKGMTSFTNLSQIAEAMKNYTITITNNKTITKATLSSSKIMESSSENRYVTCERVPKFKVDCKAIREYIAKQTREEKKKEDWHKFFFDMEVRNQVVETFDTILDKEVEIINAVELLEKREAVIDGKVVFPSVEVMVESIKSLGSELRVLTQKFAGESSK